MPGKARQTRGDDEDGEDGDSNDEDGGEDDKDGDKSSEKKEKDSSDDAGANSGQSAEEDDPVEDIFNDDAPELDLDALKAGKMSKRPRKPTIQEIIDQLSNLPDADRESAMDGLRELSAMKNESLLEAFGKKSLRELTDDEFADGINKVLDLIDKVEKPDYANPQDKKERIAKIQRLAADPYANRELQQEDSVELQKDYQKKKARQAELNRYSNYKTIDEFKINFFRSIKDQVETVEDEYDSYTRINRHAEDSGLDKPGIRVGDLPGNIPSVDLYFDMSASWTDNKKAIEIGKEAVATIKQFADKGEIKLNVYYFSNELTTDINSPVLGQGTRAWSKIIQQIKANNTKNVVLMTDLDMERLAENGPTCVVQGEVWFI